MTEISDRYRRLAAGFAARIAAVNGDGWDAPTPCEGWTARDLVGHVVGTQAMFLGLVGQEMPVGPSAEDDPGAAWAHATQVVQSDLDDPERAGVSFDGFFGLSTFEGAVDRFLSWDLVVHSWDLARATGGDEHVDAADAQWVIDGVAGFGDALRGPQICGPEVAVPPNADLTTRMLALLGRRT